MALFICLLIVAICFYLLFSKKQTPKDTRAQSQPETTEDAEPVPHDRYNDPDVIIIRSEIRAAVTAHSAAVTILQALSRIDGTTSEAERNLVFEFLNRQGAGFTYNKHREWFYTSRSGEWYRAAELKQCDEMIAALLSMPLLYRIDVFATASAIVAIGGAPKKREAEMLNRLKKLIE